MPHLPAKLLVVGLVFLLAFRIGLNVVDSNVIDVGYAGVIGADRIIDGDRLYGEGFSEDVERGDTYGPLNYLAYVPFEQALPWSGSWDDLPAAHGAAIAFDLLAVGRAAPARPAAAARAGGPVARTGARATPGPPSRTRRSRSRRTRTTRWWRWRASWRCWRSRSRRPRTRLGAAARGIAVGLGAAAKFVPLALAPLFAFDPARGRARPVVVTLALLAVLALAVIPFVPDGSLRELYDRTLGYQAGAPLAVQHLGPGRRSAGCTRWSRWRRRAWRSGWRSCPASAERARWRRSGRPC